MAGAASRRFGSLRHRQGWGGGSGAQPVPTAANPRKPCISPSTRSNLCHARPRVANAKSAELSIITGGGKWVQITIYADSLHQHLILTAERKFWRCVLSGEHPRLFGAEPPRPRLEAVRIVDMSSSNSWAEFAAVFRRTRPAYQEHEGAKADLKKLVPEDAKEAIGHGLRAKRSKAGVSFENMDLEADHALLQ